MRTVLALLVLLLLPVSAQATTVSSSGTTLTITAATGEKNDIDVHFDDGAIHYVIEEASGTPISAAAGCTAASGAVTCPADGITLISANLGDGDDYLTTADPGTDESPHDTPEEVTARAMVSCGDGDDIADLNSPDDAAADCEHISLGGVVDLTKGDDVFISWRAGLNILGLSGNDKITGRGGDILYGGSGNDTLKAGKRGESSLSGQSGDDKLTGGNDGDALFGGNDDDTVSGGRGNDEIDGGGGLDKISGGAGNDKIISKDRGAQRDVVHCGSGKDTVKADHADRIAKDCEKVTR